MKNYVQDGKVLSVVVSGANVTSGEVVVLGEFIGVSQSDYSIGDIGNFVVEGVVSIAKKAALALSFGDKVFWDKVALEITDTASSNADIIAGYVAKDAGASDAEVHVKLGSGTPPKVASVAAMGVTSNLSALAVAPSSLTALAPTASALTPAVVSATLLSDLATAGGNTYTDAVVNAIFDEVQAALNLKSDNVDLETLRTQVQSGFDLKADNSDVESLRGEIVAILDLKADNVDAETLRTQVEARLDAIETKVDALIAAMKVSGVMDN